MKRILFLLVVLIVLAACDGRKKQLIESVMKSVSVPDGDITISNISKVDYLYTPINEYFATFYLLDIHMTELQSLADEAQAESSADLYYKRIKEEAVHVLNEIDTIRNQYYRNRTKSVDSYKNRRAVTADVNIKDYTKESEKIVFYFLDNLDQIGHNSLDLKEEESKLEQKFKETYETINKIVSKSAYHGK